MYACLHLRNRAADSVPRPQSATNFAKLYLNRVRTNDRGMIAESRTSLRDSLRRMLRTQGLGEELCY